MSSKEIWIVLTPPRVEFIPKLEQKAEQARCVILELPEGEMVKAFLEGELSVDDALLELELEYPLFTRELLLCARRLKEKGKKIILLDPYQEIATDIKVKLFLRKGLEQLEQDLTARYIAMIELSISKILQEYDKAKRENNFEKLTELTMKYAKFDAERIRFKTELRIRKIIELIQENQVEYPLLVHTHFLNKLLPQELSKRLGKGFDIKIFDLYDEAQEELNLGKFYHPGRRLTEIFLLHERIPENDIRLLAAKTLILVTLYPKHEVMPTRDKKYPLLMKDFEIYNILKNIKTLEECKKLYLELTQRRQ